MNNNALQWVNAGLRRTWLVAVAAVIMCSVFAAHGISSLVEAQYLDPAPSRSVVPLHAQATAPVSVITPDGSMFVARNMFCSTCTTSGGGPGPTDSYHPPAILIATSVGRDSRATLRVPATEAQGSWGLGDVVPGVGRIERIGFVSSCALCYAFAVRGLRRSEGKPTGGVRGTALDIATGVMIAAPAYWLFTKLLKINLPGLTGTGWL